MVKERKTTKFPQFKGKEEAAEFWDTHSPEDLPEEFERAEVKFSQPSDQARPDGQAQRGDHR